MKRVWVLGPETEAMLQIQNLLKAAGETIGFAHVNERRVTLGDSTCADDIQPLPDLSNGTRCIWVGCEPRERDTTDILLPGTVEAVEEEL